MYLLHLQLLQTARDVFCMQMLTLGDSLESQGRLQVDDDYTMTPGFGALERNV